jgi:hypothetical protein
MAKVVAVTWFPRTYINRFETYDGLSKVDLKIKDINYLGKSLSFAFEGYKNYPEITFTQGWSGLHYFVVELPDEGVVKAADIFMKEMQLVLLQKILKVCHTVTYKNIVSDMMPLDFHTLILTRANLDTGDYTVEDAQGLQVARNHEQSYYGGSMTYLLGSDDPSLLKVLLYHAYSEVAHAFLFNMQKALVRLFHNADTIVDDVESAQDLKVLKEDLKVMEGIIAECASRSGKMQHVGLNFEQMSEEFRGLKLSPKEEKLAQALAIGDSFSKLKANGQYIGILWGSIMETKLQNINSMVTTRLRLRQETQKKGWF